MQRADWQGQPVELAAEKVGKAYGARRVLRDLTLSAGGGEVVAVVGENGSGKSTLLKIVAGLLRPSRGTVTFRVGGAARADGAARRASVGYAGPDLALYAELSGLENLRFFDAVAGRQRSADAYRALFAEVGLSGREGDPVGAYSSGMRQRMRLAFALLPGAPLLLLDEPSLALDAGGVEVVGRMVRAQRERGGLTLLATNDLREAALGDRSVALGA
jgi:heme ABC exporter ATP-binding subunit CcmA